MLDFLKAAASNALQTAAKRNSEQCCVVCGNPDAELVEFDSTVEAPALLPAVWVCSGCVNKGIGLAAKLTGN